jgi:hypothetical protein
MTSASLDEYRKMMEGKHLSKKKKKTRKIFIYLMLFVMLASTLLTGVAMFF